MVRLRNSICATIVFVALSSLSALSLVSAASEPEITVNSAVVSGNQVTITGEGLAGSPTAVTLNGQSLSIVSDSPTQIVATLATVPPPGTYRLFVKSGKGSTTAYVTLSNVVATFSWLNQSAAIPPTVLLTPSVDSLYRVSMYMVQTQPYPAGSSCNQSCGFVSPTFEWTDDGGIQSEFMVNSPSENQFTAIQLPLFDSSGCSYYVPTGVCPELLAPGYASYTSLPPVAGQPDAELLVRAKAGTPISFSTYYFLNAGAPAASYDVFMSVERLM